MTVTVTPAPATRIPVEEYALDNGLRVVLSEDHAIPIVAVNLWYHVGSANEREGRTGEGAEHQQRLSGGSLGGRRELARRRPM